MLSYSIKIKLCEANKKQRGVFQMLSDPLQMVVIKTGNQIRLIKVITSLTSVNVSRSDIHFS